MAINRGLVGVASEPLQHDYTWRDVVLYALGVGTRLPDELDFLFEGRGGPKVLPTFAVVPSFQALLHIVGKLEVSLSAILHGEQTVTQHRTIPPSGRLSTVATVTGIYDKGKGALAVIEAQTRDGTGERLFDNVFSLFVRGEGGFGGDRGPEAVPADPPEGKEPDFTHVETTAREQGALYRLSGDLTPLHVSPEIAKAAGFDRPILHGLCTYGHAGRAVLRHTCQGDPARFRSLSARFSGVVFPGDTLTTSGWQVGPGRYVIRVNTHDDRVVLQNSIAEVVPS
jgi:acyl dehydratase